MFRELETLNRGRANRNELEKQHLSGNFTFDESFRSFISSIFRKRFRNLVINHIR